MKEKRAFARYRRLGVPGVEMPQPAHLIAIGRRPTWDHTGSTLFLHVSIFFSDGLTVPR